MDDGKVTSENHVYSPFQLNKSFDRPLKIVNGTNVLNNDNLFEGTSGSDQSSPPNLMSSSPFSFSLKKLGNYSLSPSNTNSSSQSVQKMNDLQQENLNLKKEIEAKETKLSSTVKSIKQFWSPELKKERLARKEEREKNLELKEQLSIANTQIQEYTKTLEDLEHELNAQQLKSKNLMQQLKEQNKDTLFNNLKEQFDLQADKILSLNLIKKSHEEKISQYINEKKNLEEKIYQLQSQIENKSINTLNENEYFSNIKKIEKQEEEISLLTLTLDELEGKYNELLEDNEEKNKCISDLEIILVDKEQKEQYHEIVVVQLQTCRNTLESQEEEFLKLKYDNVILKENERRSLENLSSLEKSLMDKEMQINIMNKEIQEFRAQESLQVVHNNKTEELLLSKDKQFDILQKELELLQQKLHENEMKQDNSDEIKMLNQNVDQLSDKLKTVELQNSESMKKLSKTLEELAELKNTLTLKEKESKENVIKVEQLNAKLKTVELQNSESVKKLSKSMEELTDLKKKNSLKEKELKEHQIKIDQLNLKLKTVELQNSDSVKKLSKSMEELADLKNKFSTKEKELKEHQIKFSTTSNELSSKDAIIQSCNEEIKELKSASLDFKKTIDALQTDLSEKNSLITRFKKEKETQLSKTVSFVVYEDMKRECESLSSSNLQQKVTIEDLQHNLKSAVDANSKLESEIENCKTELLKINNEYTETKEQCKELEQSNNDLKKELQDSQTKIEKLDKPERRSLVTDKKKADDNLIVKQLQEENTQKLNRISDLEKQITEKNKQLTLIKKTQSFEKEKQHLLVNEKMKIDNEAKNQVEQLKIEIAKNKERITVLEDALRESVNVVIECENISASKTEFAQFEKAITNIKNAFLIFLMSEKDALIRSMIATRKRQSDELQNIRVNNLLSSISEKDTQIAHFEMSNSKIKRNEIIQLKKDKEKLMEELKEQNNNRVLEINQDSNEDSILLELRDAPSEQVYEAIRLLCTINSRLEFYIDEFWTHTKEMYIELLHNIEDPPQKSAKFSKTEKLSKDELMKELKLVTDHTVNLKNYVYGLLSKLEA